MVDPRPTPDALLAQVQRAESAAGRGRLKIFLGMAPGVGKTYAMLVAAQTAYESGRGFLLVDNSAKAVEVMRERFRGLGDIDYEVAAL